MTDGPFESEDQVREALRSVYEDSREGRASLRTSGYAMLNAACSAAGARTGDYDRRIMNNLASIEVEMCKVFASLITRAHEAGKAAGPDGAVTEWGACRRGEAVPFVSEADEAAVRRFAADLPNTVTGLARRQITPWEVVPYGQAPE